MKLEPNMYVRTKKGIAKIKSLDDLDNVAWTDQKGIFFGIKRPSGMLHFELDDDGYVIGIPSYNIIDLIEEGDYVNGYEVIEKPYCYHDVCFVSVNSRESWGWGIGEMPMNEIKSIVTKEQFDSMKYEVDSNEFGRIYK